MTLAARHIALVRGASRLLDDVDVDAHPGEVVAVIGPNGAGKSTLVRVLSGEWAPTTGRVELDGQRLGDMAIGQRARRLAVLPQHSMLDFPFTGREVIAMSRIAQDSPAAADARVVDEVIAVMGLDALSTRVYTTLSGGEKQRIQLGRVLAQLWEMPESACYLLDEPTAPLDLAHQLLLAETIESVKQRGAAFVLVMHDINLAARLCDRMVLMSAGRVVAAGSPSDVLVPAYLRGAYGVEVERVDRESGAPAIFAHRLATADQHD